MPSLAAAPLARDADATLTAQLAARYAERIRQRLLAPGARLPSVRECAKRHGISTYTVVAAYDQLLAQGLIEARKQRGFFVRETQPPTRSRAAANEDRPPAPVDAAALIRGMFQQPGSPLMPGFGTLPPDWLDLSMLSTALRRVTAGERLGPLALRYGEPAGDSRLRAALAIKLDGFGLKVEASQIVTTIGATQALDIVSRTLLQPGDAVLVDEPGWAVEFARLGRLGQRIVPVPRGADGPDLATMRSLIAAHKPRLYATVSVLHNPTGAMLSLAAAHQVLKLAEVHDFHIVEDDTYAHLAPAHAPRLSALDGLQRTVYVSGFSKILTPAWRVGFIAAPPALVERCIDVKLLSTLTTPAVLEQAVALCLEQGQLRRHAERVLQKLDAARARSVQLALQAGMRFVSQPQGLFGWVDAGVDTDRLAALLLDEGWVLAPGSLFHATPRPTTLMRINFATSQDARMWRALERAKNQLV
ncbi:MAG TPA: PLP-dependent aminotransferase family protein [Methylibium sp.]